MGSILESQRLIVAGMTYIQLVLVGCGGTGSWLAPHLPRIARILQTYEKMVSVKFVDPDTVEDKNVWRQHFCLAEVGRNKAEALAMRYSLAWGKVNITACPGPYNAEKHIMQTDDFPGESYYRTSKDRVTVVVIGCVDNADARQAISQTLADQHKGHIWWLDCGNTKTTGQVLLGNETNSQSLREAWGLEGYCTVLPAPHLQHPELLINDAPPTEKESGQRKKMSCAEIAQFEMQSLTINQTVANLAADYLLRMLVTGNLNRMATYVNLDLGSAYSTYITRENVAAPFRNQQK